MLKILFAYRVRSEIENESDEDIFVIRGVKLLNPDEKADPRVQTGYIFGPNNPTKIFGFNTSFELPGKITLSARGEFQVGHDTTLRLAASDVAKSCI